MKSTFKVLFYFEERFLKRKTDEVMIMARITIDGKL